MNGESTSNHGECLSEELIAGYLEGAITPVVKAACEVHLAACDRCREELVKFMRLLRTEVSPEETAFLNSVLHQWDRRNLRPVPSKSRSFNIKHWTYVLAGVAALLLIALAGWFLLDSSPSAREIIQALLDFERPFEARLAGQPYKSITITRGPEENPQYGALEQEMTDRSANAYEMGRLFLLRKDYERAARFLEQAAADAHAPSDVHNDLGVAYLQQGGSLNLAKAEKEFTRALELDQTFGPAVFNLSILYDRQGARDAAERQRLRYLELDPNSGWAGEVSQKLQRKETQKP